MKKQNTNILSEKKKRKRKNQIIPLDKKNRKEKNKSEQKKGKKEKQFIPATSTHFILKFCGILFADFQNLKIFMIYSSSLFFQRVIELQRLQLPKKNFGIELKQVCFETIYRSNYKSQLCAKLSRSHQASRIDTESLWRWPSPIMQSCPISDVWKNFQKGIIKFIC